MLYVIHPKSENKLGRLQLGKFKLVANHFGIFAGYKTKSVE